MAVDWPEVRETWSKSVAIVAAPQSIPRAIRPRRLIFRRGKVPIAITGCPGAGKTLLYTALNSDVVGPSGLPNKSRRWELHRVLIQTKGRSVRASIVIVPGQTSDERDAAFDEILGQGRAPVGVIHVVCWGLNHVWADSRSKIDEIQDRNVTSAASNEAIQRELRRDERNDFDQLCDRLDSRWVKKRLKWLMLVVSKCDLFWDELDDVRDYYIPGGSVRPKSGLYNEPEFNHALVRLAEKGLVDRRRLAVVPFSAVADEHTFDRNLVRRPYNFTQPQINALRSRFWEVLGQLL